MIFRLEVKLEGETTHTLESRRAATAKALREAAAALENENRDNGYAQSRSGAGPSGFGWQARWGMLGSDGDPWHFCRVERWL